LSAHGLAAFWLTMLGLGKRCKRWPMICREKKRWIASPTWLIVAPEPHGQLVQEAEPLLPGTGVVVLHGKDRHEAATGM
jgi:hypothetical protein